MNSFMAVVLAYTHPPFQPARKLLHVTAQVFDLAQHHARVAHKTRRKVSV